MINKRCAALVMAAIMAASSAMPAMADAFESGSEVTSEATENNSSSDGIEGTGDASTTVEGNVEAKDNPGVSVSDNASVSVKGDVSSENGDGVSASGNGSASVSGDVSSVNGDGVYAEGGSVTVGGNVSSAEERGVYAEGGSSVTVDKNVSGNGEGVTAVEGATVSVGGNVSASSDSANGISAEDATVTVKGDVVSNDTGISAGAGTYDEDYKTTVDVKGNVTAEGNGIMASGNTTVTVGGDVTSKDGEYGIEGDNGADIVVSGNITASGDDSTGIELDSGSSATVAGNVKGDNGAFVIDSKLHIKGDVISKSGVTVGVYGTDKTTCIIEGDVNSDDNIIFDVSLGNGDRENNKDNELAIAGTVKNGEKTATIYVDVDPSNKDKVKNSAEIVIGEIEDINKIDVVDYGTDEKLSDAAKKEVLDNIKYIVSTNTDSLNGNGTITVTKVGGGSLDKDKSGLYEVGKATETITIHVATKDGYEVSEIKAGKATASLVKNADGTYSVTIPAGGGVNIEALIKAIETKAVYTSSSDDDDSSSSNGTPSTWGSNGTNWTFTKANGQKAKDEWQQISYNGTLYWYYFGADMNMSTGLFTDAKGHQYYLNPAEGALKGTMATGWVEINGKWIFFNDGSVADLPLGCFVEGMTR